MSTLKAQCVALNAASRARGGPAVIFALALVVHLQLCQKEGGHCCPHDPENVMPHRLVAGAQMHHLRNVCDHLAGQPCVIALSCNGANAAKVLLGDHAANYSLAELAAAAARGEAYRFRGGGSTVPDGLPIVVSAHGAWPSWCLTYRSASRLLYAVQLFTKEIEDLLRILEPNRPIAAAVMEAAKTAFPLLRLDTIERTEAVIAFIAGWNDGALEIIIAASRDMPDELIAVALQPAMARWAAREYHGVRTVGQLHLAVCIYAGNRSAAVRGAIAAKAYGLDATDPAQQRFASFLGMVLAFRGIKFSDPGSFPSVKELADHYSALRSSEVSWQHEQVASLYDLDMQVPEEARLLRMAKAALCLAGFSWKSLLASRRAPPPLDSLLARFHEQLKSNKDNLNALVAMRYGLSLPEDQAEVQRLGMALQFAGWKLPDLLNLEKPVPPVAEVDAAFAASSLRSGANSAISRAAAKGQAYHDYASVRAKLPVLFKVVCEKASDAEILSLVRDKVERGEAKGAVKRGPLATLLYRYNPGLPGDAEGFRSTLFRESGLIVQQFTELCTLVQTAVGGVMARREGLMGDAAKAFVKGFLAAAPKPTAVAKTAAGARQKAAAAAAPPERLDIGAAGSELAAAAARPAPHAVLAIAEAAEERAEPAISYDFVVNQLLRKVPAILEAASPSKLAHLIRTDAVQGLPAGSVDEKLLCDLLYKLFEEECQLDGTSLGCKLFLQSGDASREREALWRTVHTEAARLKATRMGATPEAAELAATQARASAPQPPPLPVSRKRKAAAPGARRRAGPPATAATSVVVIDDDDDVAAHGASKARRSSAADTAPAAAKTPFRLIAPRHAAARAAFARAAAPAAAAARPGAAPAPYGAAAAVAAAPRLEGGHLWVPMSRAQAAQAAMERSSTAAAAAPRAGGARAQPPALAPREAAAHAAIARQAAAAAAAAKSAQALRKRPPDAPAAAPPAPVPAAPLAAAAQAAAAPAAAAPGPDVVDLCGSDGDDDDAIILD